MSETTKLEEPLQKLEWVVKEPEASAISSHFYSRVEKAVEEAVVPRSEGRSKDPENMWEEVDNLRLLGDDANKELLDRYLSEGKMGSKFIDKLMDNFEQDLVAFQDTGKIYSPQVLSTIQSLYLGLGLKDAKSENGQRVHRLAKARSMDKEVIEIVNTLKNLPGCEYLAGRFDI